MVTVQYKVQYLAVALKKTQLFFENSQLRQLYVDNWLKQIQNIQLLRTFIFGSAQTDALFFMPPCSVVPCNTLLRA